MRNSSCVVASGRIHHAKPAAAFPGPHPVPYLVCRQTLDFHYRPDFNGSESCRWIPFGDANRFVEIISLDQVGRRPKVEPAMDTNDL